jgi:hypothetical protein
LTRLTEPTRSSRANRPAPPLGVEIEGGVTTDTTIKWQAVPGAAGYRVWWRDTTAPQWQHSRYVGNATTTTLKNIVVDDSFFGVSAVSADGYASPVVFPGDAGRFDDSQKKPDDAQKPQ